MSTNYRIALLSFLILIVLLSGLILLFLNFRQPSTTRPTRETAVMSVYATGTVDPVYKADIAATIAGRVDKIFVQEGDQIEDGQILIQLDDSLEKSRIEEIIAAKDYLEKQVNRLRPLYNKSYVSRKDFEKSAADLLEITARLKSQRELVEKMKIRSPLSGVVLKKDIEVGEYIPAGQIVLSVGKQSPLRVTAEVDEEDIPMVQLGQTAFMKSDAFQEVISGKVYEITSKGDPVQKNFRVRISLPSDSKLLVGMTVDVNILIKKEDNALMIPKEAIINDTVFVKKGFKIESRKVQLGIIDDKKVQILKGVEENDEVVTTPQEYLGNR